MEDQIRRLVDKTWGEFQKADASSRVLVAIGGIPASGKTTIASAVVSRLNQRHHEEWGSQDSGFTATVPNIPDIAYFVPLDGYHLTRAQLAAMPYPEEAAYRRGAAFTFDQPGYHDFVRRVRERILPETTTIHAPSFDHATKDPVENDIPIPPAARIIVFEGLYVALDEEGWRDAASLMDELWFIEIAMDIAVERLVKRHVAAGLSPNEEHARARVMTSDMQNGRQILDHRLPVHETIQSVEDEAWKPRKPMIGHAVNEKGPQGSGRIGSITDLAMNGGGC